MTDYIFHSNIINFVIVVAFFIWLLFFKLDIIGFFAKKSEETINTIRKSENKKEEAIKNLIDTESSLKNVDSDIKDIIDNAKILAKKIEENSEIKIKEEILNLKSRETALREGYEKKAVKEVSQKVSKAAISVSKEYIENSLDENAHKELIYNFINDLEEMRIE